MSTTKKTASKKAVATTAVAKYTSVEDMSFEQIMNLDEKELNKQMSFDQKKNGKKSQLQAKVIDLTNRIGKCQTKFKLSLIDPTIDSVEIKVEIDCLEKEREIALSILQQLFPNEFTSPLGQD